MTLKQLNLCLEAEELEVFFVLSDSIRIPAWDWGLNSKGVTCIVCNMEYFISFLSNIAYRVQMSRAGNPFNDNYYQGSIYTIYRRSIYKSATSTLHGTHNS
jgi:hypothetical protein